MITVTTAILVVLNLTGTLNLLPDSWEARLWRQTAPEISFSVPQKRLAAQPVKVREKNLSLGARGAMAVDIESGTVLYAKNAQQVRPIASIVKLAVAAIIVRTHSLDETVTIPKLPSYPPGAVSMDLKPGQKFKLGQLLEAVLIPSANDAADALAIYDSGSVQAFADKANRLLRYWGIDDILVADASGLNDASRASPAALAKASELVLANSDVRRIVDKPEVTIRDLAGKSYPFPSTNRLLEQPDYDGIKTGFTAAAGQSVVSLVRIEGSNVVTVVLNSPDRFGETEKLVRHLKNIWEWR